MGDARKLLVRDYAIAQERATRMMGWLQWRADWTGADGPHDEHGVPWYECALRGDFPPNGYPRSLSASPGT